MKNNNKFTEVNLTRRYGMEGQGDTENEWLSPEEIAAKTKKWEEYVQWTKNQGIYGKEYQEKWSIEHEDTFDHLQMTQLSHTSYGMVILDLGK